MVVISYVGENFTAGMNVTLVCEVTGIDNLMSSIMFTWRHFNGTYMKSIENNSGILFLSPLRLSDAGEYTCLVDITSPLLLSNLIIFSMDPQIIRVFGKFVA